MPDTSRTAQGRLAAVLQAPCSLLARTTGLRDLRAASPTAGRLGLLSVADSTGTGLFLGSMAVLLVSVVRLSPAQVSVGLAIAGGVALLVKVPAALLADRVGPARFLAAISLFQAAAYCGYLVIGSAVSYIAVAALVAAFSAGDAPTRQSLLGSLVSDADRVASMAALRTLRNVGSALGGGAAALVLALGGRRALDLAAGGNAVSYLVLALAYSGMREVVPAGSPAGRRFAAVRDGQYMRLMGLSAVFALSAVLLDIGIPLWIVEATNAPRWMAAVVLVVNTVLVIAFQVRTAQGSATVVAATATARRSGWLFAVSCVLIGGAAFTSATAACLLLLLSAITLTGAEMLESSAWWTISFDLSDPRRRTEYLAAFGLRTQVLAVAGPLIVTGVVACGFAGWLVLAGVFCLAATAVPRLVGAAAAHHADL